MKLCRYCSWYFGLIAVLLCSTQVCMAEAVIPGFGTSGATDNTTIDPSSFVSVAIALDAGRSYECSADSSFSTSEPSLTLFAPGGGLADPTANKIVARGNTAPIIGVSNLALGTRLSFTPATAGLHRLTIINDLGAPNPVKIRCMETTIYGGFNTNANPFNFLELTNVTGDTIAGRVRAFHYDGTQVLDTSFSILANRRFDINLHDSTGPNLYGSVVVTHDGPLGALQGNVSQYSGSASDLTLRASVALSIRDQRH